MLLYERANVHEFASLVKELAAPGALSRSTVFDFEFANVEKQHETYSGLNVILRYFVRVTVMRSMGNIVEEHDVCVHTQMHYLWMCLTSLRQ